MSPEPALLLVLHGSRDEAGLQEAEQFAELVRRARPACEVFHCFIEFNEPSFEQAVEQIALKNASQCICVPLLLLGAGHFKNDGPRAAWMVREHAGVSVKYAPPLGLAWPVFEALMNRMRGELSDLSDWSLVLIARGSTDPDANSDLYKAARFLAEIKGAPREIGCGFVSLTWPSVPEALERLYRLGERRILVQPYFLFDGKLVKRIGEQALRWSHQHPEVDLRIGRPFGRDDAIVSLVWERYDEALRDHNPPPNCDLCRYRHMIPGHEGSYGAPLNLSAQHSHESHEHTH